MPAKPGMDYEGPDMPAGGQAPAGAPPPPEQGGKQGMGPQDVLGAIKTIESAMLAIASQLEKAGAPPEAVQALQAAISSYGEFVNSITGQAQAAKEGPKGPPVSAPAPVETAGANGAVPAEAMPPRG